MKITKKTAKIIVESNHGLMRGTVFNIDYEFIHSRYGNNGVVKLEKRMKELGYPISYKNFKATKMIPWGLRFLSFFVIIELFRLKSKDIEEMGANAVNFSFIVKMLMKFLSSPDTLIRNAGVVWKRQTNTGSISVLSYDKKNRRISAKVTGFNCHYKYKYFLKGFMVQLLQYTLPGRKITAKITAKKGLSPDMIIDFSWN